MRRYVWGIVAALVVVAGGAWWYHQRVVRAAARPAKLLQTAAVRKGTISSTMTATGTVQALQETEVRVGVGVNGTMLPFNWNTSQQVSQGQVLFHLVNPSQQQQTTIDESNLRSAQLQLQQMQASAADTQPQQAALTSAELGVQQAQYAYGKAVSAQQSDQQVLAPISGTVGAVNVSRGASVASGAAVASIVRTGVLQAQLQAAQTQVGSIKPGQAAIVFANGGNTQGAVSSVAPTPDQTIKGVPSYQVDVTLTNPGGWLPGMPVTASVETTASSQTWLTGLAGQLASPAAVNAVTQVGGTLQTLGVQVGQTVTAGQVIATVSSSSLADAVTSARQSLTQAQHALSALQVNQQANNISLPFSLQQQEIRVQQLQGAVQRDLTIDHGLVVRSPVSGTISGIQAVSGQPVGPGTPLMTIGDYSKLLVFFPLSQLYVNQVHVGMVATVTATAAPGKTFKGQLYLLAPEGTNVNGVANFQAQVIIPQPEPALRPGMAAVVTIVLGTAKNALIVPLQALHLTGKAKHFVVVVQPDGSTVHVPVTVGLTDQLDAQVKGKLTAGEKVLTSSLSALKGAKGVNLRGRVQHHKAVVSHRAPVTRRP